MYCTTLFCHLEIYVSMYYIPSAIIMSPKGGYSHVPSARCRGIFPKIHRANLWWNPHKSRLILGVTTHVSDLDIRMAWTMSHKNDRHLSISALLSQDQSQMILALPSLPEIGYAASQLSSVATRRRPRYLNEDTVSSGLS